MLFYHKQHEHIRSDRTATQIVFLAGGTSAKDFWETGGYFWEISSLCSPFNDHVQQKNDTGPKTKLLNEDFCEAKET